MGYSILLIPPEVQDELIVTSPRKGESGVDA